MKRTIKGFLILSLVFFTMVVHAAVGDLVSTFGTDGVVVTNFGTESAVDVAMGVVADSTSFKTIVVGSTTTVLGDTDFAMTRYDSTTGELDTSFGTDGYVITDFGSYEDDLAYAVAVDSESRIIVVGSTGSSDNQDIAIARYDSDGNLDTTFGGGDGLVVFNTEYDLGNDYDEYAVDVAIDSSDNIIVGSNFSDNGGSSTLGFAVTRFEGTDGDPDTTFGTYGYKVVDFTSFLYEGPFVLRDILLDASDRVLAAGCVTCETASSDSFLVRLTTAGALDSTFSLDGIYMVDITRSLLEDGAYKIAMGSSGKIYMVGGADNSASLMDFFVERLRFSGTPDTTFGTLGIVTTDFAAVFGTPTDEVALNVKFSSSTGNATVLGYAGSSGAYFLLAARYDSNGNLDPTFDSSDSLIDGMMSSSISGLTGEAFDYANATAFKGNIGYFAAGSNSDDDFTTSLFDTTLTPSTTFDTDGIATADFPKSSSESISSLAEDSSGNIYAAGGQIEQGSTDDEYDFALARYTSAGVLDTTFGGGDGLVVTTLASSATDVAQKVLVDSSDRPILVGYVDNTSSDDFVVVRYDTGGTLDATFSGDGIVMTDFGSFDDKAYAAVLDDSGNIILGGTSYTSSSEADFALAKYDSNGSLDMTFGGGDGLATLDVSGASQRDVITDLVLDASGNILVAGYVTTSTTVTDFALARFDSNGNSDTSFGGGGYVVTDVATGSSWDYARTVTVQSDGKILVAGSSLSSGAQVYLDLLRYDTNGTLDETFGGGDGIVTVEATNGMRIGGMIVEASGKILVVGSYLSASGYSSSAVYRFDSDGNQDSGFMVVADTPVTLDLDGFEFLNDSVSSAFINNDGNLIMGGSAYNNTDFALAAVTLQSCGDNIVDGTEECDDGGTDSYDGCSSTCSTETPGYLDLDEDGYGCMDTTSTPCVSYDESCASGATGCATNATDCDESNSDVHPGATETCNSIDDDCDGTVDEGSTEVCGDGIDQDCDGSDTACPVAATPAALDSDDDGVLDSDDAFPNDASESVDTDGDGMGNNADTDDDGDGIEDATGVASAALDSDGDGVLDPDDVFPQDASESSDADQDGVGDNADTDDDGDGIDDSTVVSTTLDSDGDGTVDSADPDQMDSDGDGTVDSADPDQMDSDGDGTVDSADPDQMDSDSDGVVDAEDALPTDADNDGIDDASDPDVIDTDSDGVVDAQDSDDDADGLEDDADDDDDGDGITDVDESESADAAGAAKSTGCGCSFVPNHGDTTTQNALMGFLVLVTGAIFGMMRRRTEVLVKS